MLKHSALPLFLAAVVMASGQAHAAVLTKSMDPFGVVKICTPFNVLIKPSSSNEQYQVLLDADQNVQSALQATVTRGVLTLGAAGHFSTSQPIKLTVRLPASALQEVDNQSAVAIQAVVLGGFSTGAFTAHNSGVSSLYIRGLDAQSASLLNSGTGSLVFQGMVPAVSIASSGTGTVYVSGVSASVNVNLSGIGNAAIDAASNSVTITGQVAGLAKVVYNQGTCNVQSEFGAFFAGPCQQGAVDIPRDGVDWTCGLKMDGTFNCSTSSGTIVSGSSTTVINSSGGGGTTSTSTSGGGAFSSQQTFTSGSGSAFASSSSSSRGQGVFGQSVSTGPGGGIRTTVHSGERGMPCTANAQSCMMVPSF